MSDERITSLPTLSDLDGTEWLAAATSSTTYRLSSGTYGKALKHDGVWLSSGAHDGTVTLNNEQVVGAAVYVGATSQTINSIGVNVTSAGETGSVIRLGIYAIGSDGKPGSLLIDAGTVASDTTGNKTITNLGLSVSAQWVLPVACQQGAATTPCKVTRVIRMRSFGAIADTLNGMVLGYIFPADDAVSAGLNDPFELAGFSNVYPLISVEV